MALTYGYFNSIGGDRKYTAETMSKYFSGIISRGVLQNYANKFQVLANSDLTVQVSTGKAYFTNGQWVENDAIINLTLDAASVSLSRIDRIVLRKDTSENLRNVSLVIKNGTPASAPIAPALENSDFVEELSLCQILISPNATSINQSNITDERPNNTLCGFTHQLFDQVETTDLFAQYDTAFNDWFTDVKETLTSATMVRQYTNTYTTVAQDQKVIPIDIAQFNVNLDILNVYVNGLKLVQDVDYTKAASTITLALGVDTNTQIEFQVLKSVDSSDVVTVIDQVAELQTDVAILKENAMSKLVRQYTNTYITATQDQKVIPINIAQFNVNLDILNVYVNGLKLVQDVDYTKTASTITLALGVDINTQIEFEVLQSVDDTEAATIVSQVAELQTDVSNIKKYTYYCNGSNDNKLLTEICEEFLESTGIYNNHSKLTIDVIGQFGIDTSILYDGEEGKIYSLAIVNATNKELNLDFAHCDTITAKGAFMYAQGVTIRNLSVKHANNINDSDIYTLSGFNTTFENCNITGQYNGGDCSAIYLNNSKALNCTIDVISAGLIYGFNGSNSIMDNCDVNVESTALSAYGANVSSSYGNNCKFKGITSSTATDASGNGGIGGGNYSNCIFEGFGGLKGHGFYLRSGYLANISNCIFRGYTKDSTNGLGVGFITAAGDASTIFLHGINCNQVSVTSYSQTASMNIAGGYGVYDGLFYAAPTIYNTENVVSHGSYNRNRV